MWHSLRQCDPSGGTLRRAQRTNNDAVCCGACAKFSIREVALSKVEISRHQAACHLEG